MKEQNLNETPNSALNIAVSRSYLILSGEGNIETEHLFCGEFDDIDKCNAFFDRLKSGDFKYTYLYIYEAVKLREE
jgi:hypothetical protein